MLLDLLNSDNYIQYNRKLAHTIGLQAAIYCSELLNIYSKAHKKNKLIDENYIKLDRKYIFERTTLSIEEQLIADLNLIKINVIKKSKDNPDIISIDIQLLSSIITCEDVKIIEDISKKVKIKSPKGTRESARQRKIAELKNSIICSNYELLTALRDWVDSIYSKPGGYLSEPVIKLFQNTLNNYTQGDLDLALRIVNIATAQSYKECQWAINVYEKDKAIAQRKVFQPIQNNTRVTTQVKADIKSLSDEVF